MLELYYEGTDMTGYVNVTGCTHREWATDRADSLEVTFDHAAAWHNWGVQADDAIEARLDGYSTGRLYLNSVLPEGDSYRIIATTLPTAAKRKAWACYRGERFTDLMHRMAVECGMGDAAYGLEGDWKYPFLLRRDEGAAAFLARIGRWEGLAVRALDGAFKAVSIAWAQERTPAESLWIDTDQAGVRYITNETRRLSAMTVVLGDGRTATARDTEYTGRPRMTVALPATEAAEAGRWARGLLLMNNRQCERLEIESTFNPSVTALTGVDVEGNTAANGGWLVDEVEHDMINLRTTRNLLRRVVTVQ